jgi:hypothetical protein
MLLACYLVSAAIFYVVVARFAPIAQEPDILEVAHPAPCEVIELFTNPADQSASRAA